MGNYENLKQSITEVIRTNGNQEITGAVLQSTLLTIISTVGANATFAGIATPATNPGTPDGPVFWIAGQGGQYTNFGGIELQDGLSVLMWNGSWSTQPILSIDDEPTAGSDNLVKSGGVQEELALGAVYDVSAKNPTGGSNNDGKWESLSALLSDANLNTLIPTTVRKGGMSIKFVQSSDNKYVQARLMANSFTTAITEWQVVEDEPSASDNLVSGKGITKRLRNIDGIYLSHPAFPAGTFDGVVYGVGEIDIPTSIASDYDNNGFEVGKTIKFKMPITFASTTIIVKGRNNTAAHGHAGASQVCLNENAEGSIAVDVSWYYIRFACGVGNSVYVYSDNCEIVPIKNDIENLNKTVLGSPISDNNELNDIVKYLYIPSTVVSAQLLATVTKVRVNPASSQSGTLYRTGLFLMTGNTVIEGGRIYKDFTSEQDALDATNTVVSLDNGIKFCMDVSNLATRPAYIDYECSLISENINNDKKSVIVRLDEQIEAVEEVEEDVKDIKHDLYGGIDELPISNNTFLNDVVKYLYIPSSIVSSELLSTVTKVRVNPASSQSGTLYRTGLFLMTGNTVIEGGRIYKDFTSEADALAATNTIVAFENGVKFLIDVSGLETRPAYIDYECSLIPTNINNDAHTKGINETVEEIKDKVDNLFEKENITEANKLYQLFKNNIISGSPISIEPDVTSNILMNIVYGQGFAIYNGKLVLGFNEGHYRIYNIGTQQEITQSQQNFGCAASYVHCGSMMFRKNVFYDNADTYPVLYVSANNQPKCFVERITEASGGTLLQTITVTDLPNIHAILTNFFVDIDRGKLWMMYNLDRTPCDRTGVWIYCWDLPTLASAEVTLSCNDSEVKYYAPSSWIQGGVYNRGKLYIIAGMADSFDEEHNYEHERVLMVVNLISGHLDSVVNMNELSEKEPEGIGIYNGDLYISFSTDLHKLSFSN